MARGLNHLKINFFKQQLTKTIFLNNAEEVMRGNSNKCKTQLEKNNLKENIAFLIDSQVEILLVLGDKDYKFGQLKDKQKVRTHQEEK